MAFKVLIIEDDFITQLHLQNVISDLGHTVVGMTGNGDDGLMLAAQYAPNLALIDIGIRGAKDGIETAIIIKEKYNIPIVFFTGNSDKSTLQRAKDVNPVHIIMKPIDDVRLKIEFSKIHEKLKLKEVK